MTRKKRTMAFAALLLAAAAAPGEGMAVSLSPMRLLVTSYTDVFAVRVNPKNPYQHRIRMEVKVYDQNFRLVKARVQPKVMTLGAGGTRQVVVTVPFQGKFSRKVRICAESIPFPTAKMKIRTQVCGRFFARRVN